MTSNSAILGNSQINAEFDFCFKKSWKYKDVLTFFFLFRDIVTAFREIAFNNFDLTRKINIDFWRIS